MSSSHGAPVARVAHAAPQVHHLLAAHVRGHARAQLAALGEVASELALDLLEARSYGAGYRD